MIGVDFVRMMARYNQWQNRSLYAAADGLSDAVRREPRGAFWGSIHGTLSHLVWGDEQWHSRFTADVAKPSVVQKESSEYCPDWSVMKTRRQALDARMIAWADAMDPSWPYGNLTWYSGSVKREISRPLSMLLVHFFNHQTHHRGQAHAMLTAAGAKPDDTDLMLMPSS